MPVAPVFKGSAGSLLPQPRFQPGWQRDRENREPYTLSRFVQSFPPAEPVYAAGQERGTQEPCLQNPKRVLCMWTYVSLPVADCDAGVKSRALGPPLPQPKARSCHILAM